MKLTLYRFTSPNTKAVFTKTFENDDLAFQYADEMVDGPESVGIERWNTGDWYSWSNPLQQWIYIPKL